MLQTWGRLRHLLLELDRLPLRQTLLALKALSWGTVWKMSGNVFHHRDLSQAQLRESLRHLQTRDRSISGKASKGCRPRLRPESRRQTAQSIGRVAREVR